MKTAKYFIPAFGLLALLALTITARASVTSSTPTPAPYVYTQFSFLTATTTTATSTNLTGDGGYFNISGAKKVTMYFSHGGTATTSTGGAVFKVQVSPDGTTWYDFSRMLGFDVSATATSSVTLQGATSTQGFSLDLDHGTFLGLRCVSTEMNAPLGTDGEQTCKATADY